MKSFPSIVLLSLATFASTASCSSGASDTDEKTKIAQGMHDALLVDLDGLLQAAIDIQAAAPTGHAWSATTDAAAIDKMRAAWARARTAYERVEGAIAPLFPEIDFAIDARYDDFTNELLNQGGDKYLFDDTGVTGMHAIERIVYADRIPKSVVDVESQLPGYLAAAFPASEKEAADFKNALCQKLITDSRTLRDQWSPQKIDLAGAFQGLVSLVEEQREKVNKAATFSEESRYSQRTMVDLRDNLAGTKSIYALFRPWLITKTNGAAIDGRVTSGLDSLQASYAQFPGDAIPQPPATWSSLDPTPADLMTPFGKLYTTVRDQCSLTISGSLASEMNAAGSLLGLAQ